MLNFEMKYKRNEKIFETIRGREWKEREREWVKWKEKNWKEKKGGKK